jgi:pimeloyl-ACP methyl ester carboxylesterase
MDIATFHASRRFADVKSGRIAFYESGQGPAALFVHGVPLNGFHWRHVIDRVGHRRRCIAIDLMGLGYSEIAPSQDVSFTAQAHMIAEVIDALGIERIDLIGDDSGGAVAQIFAAHYPNRLTLEGEADGIFHTVMGLLLRWRYPASPQRGKHVPDRIEGMLVRSADFSVFGLRAVLIGRDDCQSQILSERRQVIRKARPMTDTLHTE